MSTTLGEAVVRIKASLKPLEKSLKSAKSLTQNAVKGIASGVMRSMTKVLDSIARIVKRIAKIITVALTAAFGLATREAVKFEKQMASINTMLDDQTEPLLERFANDLSYLSKRFGQTTDTLSKGLYDILSASIPAEKAIGVLEVSARAAVAGLTDTGVAADALTTIINSYRMSADDAAMISDKLFSTVKRGKTTFPELAQSLGRVTSTAAIAGLSLDELLSVVATLTRAGIQTTEAVTSINGVLRAFLSPQDSAIDAAKEFGLELSSTTLKTIGFLGAIKKLDGAQAEQLASIVPNIRAFKALAGALQNVEGVEKDLGLISEQSAGKTQEAFDKMASTTSFSLAQMRQSVKAAGRSFGKPLLDPLKTLTDITKTTLGQLEMFFTVNGAAIQQWGNLVNIKVIEAINYFKELLAVVRDEGWVTALKKIGASIVDALKISIEFIKPAAIEIGRLIAEGFQSHVLDTKLGRVAAFPMRAAGAIGRGLRRGAEAIGLPGAEGERIGLNPALMQRPSEDLIPILQQIAANTEKGYSGDNR